MLVATPSALVAELIARAKALGVTVELLSGEQEALAAGMGQYVGQVINEGLFRRIRATQLSFLQNMLGQGLLGSRDGVRPTASALVLATVGSTGP